MSLNLSTEYCANFACAVGAQLFEKTRNKRIKRGQGWLMFKMISAKQSCGNFDGLDPNIFIYLRLIHFLN